jgi:hypothetical protein
MIQGNLLWPTSSIRDLDITYGRPLLVASPPWFICPAVSMIVFIQPEIIDRQRYCENSAPFVIRSGRCYSELTAAERERLLLFQLLNSHPNPAGTSGRATHDIAYCASCIPSILVLSHGT